MRHSADGPTTIVCTTTTSTSTSTSSTHDANDALDLEAAAAASATARSLTATALPNGTAAGTRVGTDASAVQVDRRTRTTDL
ncbi:hypothetical protein [Streptomyces sp. MI02-7b]|uniref:hypothetical protein n=1 Tax=Streptomyces sp. MI02-7b TaxID=462941 RepID=UPI0029B690D3|nr:hypothetical protein [Streptomyces sp. MI02-7b]MDX3076802.1 hypothetical protein [Streptomyces sp. MI02-7b]